MNLYHYKTRGTRLQSAFILNPAACAQHSFSYLHLFVPHVIGSNNAMHIVSAGAFGHLRGRRRADEAALIASVDGTAIMIMWIHRIDNKTIGYVAKCFIFLFI